MFQYDGVGIEVQIGEREWEYNTLHGYEGEKMNELWEFHISRTRNEKNDMLYRSLLQHTSLHSIVVEYSREKKHVLYKFLVHGHAVYCEQIRTEQSGKETFESSCEEDILSFDEIPLFLEKNKVILRNVLHSFLEKLRNIHESGNSLFS